MTYQELEEIGLKTVVKDTHSFISKTTNYDDVWLEIFCCNEKNYMQIMRATKGIKGETLRQNLYEGNLNINAIKQFIK
jgi:hypothetical protein